MNLIISKEKENTKLPAVMRAALRLFMKKGIDGTTIKDIAREAKVAEGTLYRHYKGKDDLAWHLFRAPLQQFTKDLESKVFAEQTAEGRIRRFVEESFAAYESDPELYTYLILREHGELDNYAKDDAHPGHIVIRIIEEGQKSGELKAGNPYVLGSLFVGGVIRVAVVKMYGSIREDLTQYTGYVADSIWAMLKGRGDHDGPAGVR
jgi:AcrR family transcriptional regulator